MYQAGQTLPCTRIPSLFRNKRLLLVSSIVKSRRDRVRDKGSAYHSAYVRTHIYVRTHGTYVRTVHVSCWSPPYQLPPINTILNAKDVGVDGALAPRRTAVKDLSTHTKTQHHRSGDALTGEN